MSERNPLIGFQVDPNDITWVGSDLRRPECILAEPDGALWVADARGGVTHLLPDGQQTLVAPVEDTHFNLRGDAKKSLVQGTLPNGLAFTRSGDILISNFGTDALELMDRQGRSRLVLNEIDGLPLGKVNFVLRDSRDRIWFTVSTKVNPWTDAIRKGLNDGYVCVLDERGARVVADGFSFTNEIRFDATEEWLYVAETTAKRVSRLRVRPDGSLTAREVYGPSTLGPGLIDGLAFDGYGNLWCTMVFADRLVAITPGGDLLTLLDDGNPSATARFEAAFESGEVVPFETLDAAQGSIAPWMASVTFGGRDLRTVYLGHLRGTRIPSFRSPVAGLPMVHWNEQR